MVGCTTFSRIDTRLRQIYGVDKTFGGISIVLVGDLYQLPPIMERPIFTCLNMSQLNIFINNIL